MSGSNANEGNDSAPAGSGLGNLFALAHLATMTDAERAASSRTNSPAETSAKASDAAKASSPTKPKASSSRRPAKKRAVPADLDAGRAPKAAANKKPPAKRPAHARRLTIETSRPTARRAARRGFKMKANQPSFPVVLMAMMSAERNGDSIAFLSDGQSFIVVNPGALERNVLPIHFEENVPSLEEFWHLLAIWGFEVVKDPRYPQVNVYRHPLFRKGDWESCLQMKLPDPSRSAPEEPQEDARPPPPAPASPRREAVAPAADPLEPPRSVTPPLPQLGMGPNEGAMYRRLLELQSKMGQQDPMAGLSLNALALSRRASLDAMQTTSMVNPMTMGQVAMPFAQGVGTVPRRPVAKQGPRRLTNATAPSDAEVRSATQDVVSAAVDALRKQASQAPAAAAKKPSPSKRNFARSRRHTVDALPSHGIFLSRAGPTSHLDVMTEQFLARSHARLNSRPAIMGPRRPTLTSTVPPPAGLAGALSREALAASVGAEVELRTKATLLAQQQQRQGRKVSMLGSLGGGLM